MSTLDKINNGLLLKDRLYNKIWRTTTAFLNKFMFNDFSVVKNNADHYIDHGWADNKDAVFLIDGWKLTLTSGRWVFLEFKKLGFKVGTDKNSERLTINILTYPDSLSGLLALDKALDSFFSSVDTKVPTMKNWLDDLKNE